MHFTNNYSTSPNRFKILPAPNWLFGVGKKNLDFPLVKRVIPVSHLSSSTRCSNLVTASKMFQRSQKRQNVVLYPLRSWCKPLYTVYGDNSSPPAIRDQDNPDRGLIRLLKNAATVRICMRILLLKDFAYFCCPVPPNFLTKNISHSYII